MIVPSTPIRARRVRLIYASIEKTTIKYSNTPVGVFEKPIMSADVCVCIRFFISINAYIYIHILFRHNALNNMWPLQFMVKTSIINYYVYVKRRL